MKPAKRRESALQAVASGKASIRLVACTASILSVKAAIVTSLNSARKMIKFLIGLSSEQQKHLTGDLGFDYLRNVKGFQWNHKQVYRIYRKLALNRHLE